MPLVTWTDDLSVGIDSIDSDHKLLVDLLNQLHAAVEDGERKETVGSVLNVLIDYTEYHFEREEVMMEACGYPDLGAHGKDHGEFKAKVIEIRDSYLGDPQSVLGADVRDFLKTWLATHIKGTDRLYIPHMAKATEAVAKAGDEFARRLRRMASQRDLDDSLF